ncbi:hypothetical protein [Agarilytica rhodophyticola]|uniref:hypothetical protein n=1 Tax=Agarilytica rhodophyticola TaxID=1737490 RepID=UPI000B34915B|nr:hypothetical protein [Agarilytica rhodophyticola]
MTLKNIFIYGAVFIFFAVVGSFSDSLFNTSEETEIRKKKITENHIGRVIEQKENTDMSMIFVNKSQPPELDEPAEKIISEIFYALSSQDYLYDNETKISLLAKVASFDTVLPLKWLRENDLNSQYFAYNYQVFSSILFEEDSRLAGEEVLQLPEGVVQEQLALEHLYRLASAKKLSEAEEWKKTINPSSRTSTVIGEELINQIAMSDYKAYEHFVQANASDYSSDELMYSARLAGNSILIPGSEEERRDMLNRIIEKDGLLAPGIVSGYISNAAAQYPNEVQSWINTIPHGKIREESILSFANFVASEDTLVFLDSIPNSIKKTNLIELTVRKLMFMDENAHDPTFFLDSMQSISTETRNDILKNLAPKDLRGQ